MRGNCNVGTPGGLPGRGGEEKEKEKEREEGEGSCWGGREGKGRGSVSAAEQEGRASEHQARIIRLVTTMPTAGPYIVLLYCGGPYCACVHW